MQNNFWQLVREMRWSEKAHLWMRDRKGVGLGGKFIIIGINGCIHTEG